jgi:hypothetical protein
VDLGTGQFLVAAYEWFLGQTKGGAIERDLAKRVKAKTYFGQDLVPRARRPAAEWQEKKGDAVPISRNDARSRAEAAVVRLKPRALHRVAFCDCVPTWP